MKGKKGKPSERAGLTGKFADPRGDFSSNFAEPKANLSSNYAETRRGKILDGFSANYANPPGDLPTNYADPRANPPANHAKPRANFAAKYAERRANLFRVTDYSQRLLFHLFASYNDMVARTIQLIERHHIPYITAANEQSTAIELTGKGLHCVCANPNDDEGLKRLNAGAARLVIACSNDTTNINIVLAIATRNKTPVLAVMENEERAQLAYAAGAGQVVVLEETLGRQLVGWICADAIPTEFLKLIDIQISPRILHQLKPSIIHIGSRSKFSDQTIGEARIRTKTGATIAAIWHSDGTVTSPTADTRSCPGLAQTY